MINYKRGSIFCEAAYAKGKMLNHSNWNGTLPRNMTPSDIDMILDFNGTIVAVELKPDSPRWSDLSYGQRLLYENLVRAGEGKIVAVCAHHITPPDRQVDTVHDIAACQVMGWEDGAVRTYEVEPGTLVDLFKKVRLI